MREIKFRAYIRELKKIYTITGLHYMGGSISEVAIFDGGQFNWFHILDVDLMQYTGLKDKNGKEIYEGDIIEGIFPNNRHKTTQVVEYKTNGYHQNKFNVGSQTIGFNIWHVDYEIIGNIYEKD